MELSDFILKRTIFEIRFLPGSFAFFGRAGPLMDEYVGEFEKFEAGPDFFKVSRARDDLSVMIQPGRCGADAQREADRDIDLETLVSTATMIMGAAATRFGRPNAGRIGYRHIYLRPLQDFDSAVRILRDSIAAFSAGPLTAPGLPITDVGVAVVYEVDGFHRLNFTVGPFRRSEITTKLPIREDGSIPEAALVLDLDYSTSRPRGIMDEALARRQFNAESAAQALRSFVSRAQTTITEVANRALAGIGEVEVR